MVKWKNTPKNLNKYQGFVYKITHKETGNYYIGKKFYWETKKKKPTKYLMENGKWVKDKKGKRILNNRKNRIHTKVETDWRNYWGSNRILQEHVEEYGEDAFEKTILKNCTSKWECAYEELLAQLKFNVLFDEKAYNEIINVRLRKRKNGRN